MTAQLTTAFDAATLAKIEASVTTLRNAKDDLEKIYWASHKHLSAVSYNNREEQQREMVALGELAKGIQGLTRATSDVYCMNITATRGN